MFAFLSENWLNEVSQSLCRRSPLARRRRTGGTGVGAEALERRTLLSVNLNSSYLGLAEAGSVPPDTCGAAGPTSYVETENQTLAIYTPKATGTTSVSNSFNNFWFTQGALPHASATAGLSDPIVVWDDQVNRFIVGDQEVDNTNHLDRFDIAVSKSASPATLTAADWNFYSVNTTETGRNADYPGNFGYNRDAFVFTLNQNQAVSGAGSAVQVTSISINDLVAGNPITPFLNDTAGLSIRPTVMHDSVAGGPMWLLQSQSGGGNTVSVTRMANVLSNAPTFTTTNLTVNAYSGSVQPKQPNGTGLAPASGNGALWTHILKAAEFNNTIVASDQISVSATQDDARWYSINVSGATPTLNDQGNVSIGNNGYVVFPAIDINSKGDIGMTYLESSNTGPNAGEFMSSYVTGRRATDPAGTMETPVLVQSGLANCNDGREGDLSGISTDSDGSFYAANEYALGGGNAGRFGTVVAHFTLGTKPVITPPSTQTSVEGASTSINLGSFADPDDGPWSVTVAWGDGTPNTTFSAATAGSLGAKLHTYAEEGAYTVTETVTDATNLSDTKTFAVNTSDPAVVATGNFALTPAEGADSGNQTVATFTDPGGVEGLSHYSATIDWGDGSTSTGTISVSGGTFTVKGGHTYAEESAIDHAGSTPYVIAVTVGHDGTTPQSVNSSATVSDPAVVPTGGQTFTAVEGQPSAVQTVATFTDPGGAEVAADYGAVINWGDGSTSTGTVVSNGDGSFSVTGGHTYATGLGSPGDYGSTFCDATPPHYSKPITVTISHENAPTATATSTAVIAAPPNSAFLTADGNLIVVGNAGDDQINVTPVGNTGQVKVQINDTKFGPFALAANGRIVVAGLSGNDNIQVAGAVRLPTVLFGGPGDDRLNGGNGRNIEVGCDGNDLLIGGNSNDLLIGGGGADRLVGGGGDDTLVGGITSEDYNTLLTYQSNYNLLIGNVTDDGSQDVLTGSSGNNVFFYHFPGSGGVADIVTGHAGTQFNT